MKYAYKAILCIFLSLCLFFISKLSAQQLAFPTAEGYGKYTKGGRGGVVYEVTNLNDAGAGSLRAAVEAGGARTVVFRVSGTIILNSDLKIRNPYITIAGQTAPGDGICIRKYSLVIEANEVIIRYIRVRLGNESGLESDAVSGRFVKNIILDHVSASWSVDETMSIYHCDSMTIQWCIISESMYNSNHPKGAHGFGGIWGSNYSTYHHNLIAHHSSRNPRFASGSGNTDYRNNVIYNWGYNSCYGGEQQQVGDTAHYFSNFNMVANYYKPGPATITGTNAYRIANPSYRSVKTDYGKWYVADNVISNNSTVTTNNWNGGVQPQGGSGDLSLLKLVTPWPAMPINQQTALEAYNSVLANSGARLPKTDIIDQRVIDNTRNGNATYEGVTYELNNTVANASLKCGIIDSQSDVGGWPTLNSLQAPTDTDHDGMPDSWEIARGLNPNSALDRNGYNTNGYTNLENYLNGDTVVATSTVNTCVSSKVVSVSNSGNWLYAKDSSSSIITSVDTLNMIASVKDSGNISSFFASYFVANTLRLSANGKPLLNRNITLTPTSNPANAVSMLVRLYFTVAEFNALRSADPSINSISDLMILRSSNSTCVSSVSSVTDVINPDAYGSFGSYNNGYYLEFVTPNYGTFFIASKSSSTLPLELKSFDATIINNNKQVRLFWTSLNEVNTQYYLLQKSNDGINFNEIGKIIAIGNSSLNNYSFLDTSVSMFPIYYRLKAQLQGGSFLYSNILRLDTNTTNTKLNIYPNPANSYLVINHPKAIINTTLSIIDASGKTLKQFIVANDSKYTTIGISDLPQGAYNLLFLTTDTRLKATFIKY